MSSTVIRSTFRSALQAAFPGVPYVDVIARNVENESLPALWMTMEFAPSAEFRASIGTPAHWREQGVVYVTCVGVTGGGDAAVVAQATAVRDYFRNYQAPANGIIVRSVAIQSPQQDSDGRWFFCTAALEYERTFTA